MATYIAAHDNEPMVFWLSDRDGPVQINAALEVKFGMRAEGGPVIGGVCEVLDDGTAALRGKGRYAWAAGQTDTPGVYRAEFQVRWPDGKIRTYPSQYPADIVIREDIAV